MPRTNREVKGIFDASVKMIENETRSTDGVRSDTGDELAAMVSRVGCQAVELFGSVTGEPFGITGREAILMTHLSVGAGIRWSR